MLEEYLYWFKWIIALLFSFIVSIGAFVGAIKAIYWFWEKFFRKFKFKRGELVHVLFEEEYAKEFYSFEPRVDIIKYGDDLLQIRDAWIMFRGDTDSFGKQETTTYKYSLNRDTITPKEIKHTEKVSFGHVWLPQNLSEVIRSNDVYLFFKDGKDKERQYCFKKKNISFLKRWFATRQIKRSKYIVHIICGNEITRDHRGRVINKRPWVTTTKPVKRGTVVVREFELNLLSHSTIQPSDSISHVDEKYPLEIRKYRYYPDDLRFFVFFVKNYHPYQDAVVDRGVLQCGDEHFELHGNYSTTTSKVRKTFSFNDIYKTMTSLGLTELPTEDLSKFSGEKEILEGEKLHPSYANNDTIPFGQTLWVVMKLKGKNGKVLLGKSVKVILNNGSMPVSLPFEFVVGTEKELIVKHTTTFTPSPFVP